jgi:hypothetical protein
MKYIGFSALVVLVLAGCSALVPPQAWETGALAKPAVSMGGDALEQRNAMHVYATAAMSLPGVIAAPAAAETAPENGRIALMRTASR